MENKHLSKEQVISLKAWLKSHKIDQKDLCPLIKRTEVQISKYFNFKSKMEIILFERILDHFEKEFRNNLPK